MAFIVDGRMRVPVRKTLDLNLPAQKFIKDIQKIRASPPPVSIKVPFRPPSKKIIGKGGPPTPRVITTPKPKKKVTILDTIGALGPEGLAKVYVAGGAYGSKEAVKTTITEVIKGQGLPTDPVLKLWDTDEWKGWTPKTEPLPIIGVTPPSIQIDPQKPFDLGLPSWEDLKKPLLIAGIVGAGLLLLPSIIGALKK